jgi:hypothetical protein
MATEDQGIMSLPQAGAEAPAPAPQMSMDDAYDAIQGAMQEVSPEVSGEVQGAIAQITPMLDQLSDEELDRFLELLQYLIEHPEEYSKLVSDLVAQGELEEGMLPEEYDPELLSALAMVFFTAHRQRQAGNEREMTAQMPQPPMGMAKGGIAEAARMVASKGRNGDSMLAHITPSEAALLKRRGGSGTINPATGLPEFFVKKVAKAFKSTVKRVVNVVKKVVKSPVGRILGTMALAAFLGPGAFGITGMGLSAGVSSALASGTITALGGGSMKDVLRSAAVSYLGAPGGPVAKYIGNAGAALGVTNAAGQAAINAGLTGAGVGLLTGQKLGDAVKSGLIAGAVQGGMTGFKEGFSAQVKPPTSPLVPMPLANSAAGAAPVPEVPPAPGQVNPSPQGPVPMGEFTGAAPTGAAPTGPVPMGEFTGPFPSAPGAAPVAGAPAAGGTTPPAPGIFDKVKGLYNEYLSPSGIQERGAQDALAKVQKQFPNATMEQIQSAPQGSPLAKAYNAAMPGVVSTYGPLAAAGLGIAGLMGGFSPKEPAPSALAQELKNRDANRPTIEQEPSKYFIQNLPGVQYDDKGRIIGSKPWSPSVTMDDVRVPSTPRTPPTYTLPPIGAAPPLQLFQPYNTADMYSNLMPPISRAYGGVASLAQGGYPRRTGQISGPGTETSDSIPAMLSDGEFVMTAKAVRAAGKGDRRAGAKKMYALMHQLERNASRG